jgi:predicted Zn-ribbon and HTH transcriptional regulator
MAKVADREARMKLLREHVPEHRRQAVLRHHLDIFQTVPVGDTRPRRPIQKLLSAGIHRRDRQEGMSFVKREVAHCDVCGHEWLLVSDKIPTHCAKCKSRKWNQPAEKKPKKRFAER